MDELYRRYDLSKPLAIRTRRNARRSGGDLHHEIDLRDVNGQASPDPPPAHPA